MNNGLLTLGLMMACMSVVSAEPPQEQPQAWAEKMFGPPTNRVHDFGIVLRGEQLHHDFVMTNIYAVPIEINIRYNGCSDPIKAWTSKDILQPNEKATISVQMDTRRFIGQKSSAIYVTVGHNTYMSTAQLTVKAFNRAAVIICEPGEVAFGSVLPGQTPTETVDIDYAGKLAWQVSEVVVRKDAPFEATVMELYRRPSRVGYQVKVSLKKNAAPGQFHESIFLKTNNPSAALFEVLVRGNIQSPLAAVPAALNLNEVKSGETLTRKVLVRSPKPFKVVGIEGPDGVKLGVPPLPNQLQTVTLEIKPPPQEGPFHYEVKIKTDLQNTPVVVVIDGVVPKK